MFKRSFALFIFIFVSFFIALSSCNEPSVVENSTKPEAIRNEQTGLNKVQDKLGPVGEIIGYKIVEVNGEKKKIPIYYSKDYNDSGIKALSCDYYSTYVYELEKYQSKPGKWLGIWTNLKTKSELNQKYGFSQMFVSSYQAKLDAISAGYNVDNLMGGIDFSPSSVDQYGYLKYYHLDEPIERYDAYPEDIRFIAQYVHDHYSNSLVMMASYQYPDTYKWYNWPTGRLAKYKTLYKDETMDLASNTRIMCDKYHDAFMNPIDQRPYWSEFKNNYGNENIANWISLKEDYEDNQFGELLQKANSLGINKLWIYGLYTGIEGYIDTFCDAAFINGWLRKFVKKYKYMYHCPEYHGDPCWCSKNDDGWELAWIQYIGIIEL